MKKYLLKCSLMLLGLKRKLLAFPFLLSALLFSSFGADDERFNNQWVLHSEVNGVEVHYMISECNEMNMIYLKLVNNNSTSVTISWEEEIWTPGYHIEKNPSGTKYLNLTAGQTVEAGCDLQVNEACAINVNFLVATLPTVEKFNVYNVEVTL